LASRDAGKSPGEAKKFIGFAPRHPEEPYRIKFFCFFFSKKRSASFTPSHPTAKSAAAYSDTAWS
jgi:hypothetical protein